MVTKTKRFVQDVQVEMKKVTWPSRDELKGSTLVVIVTVIIIAIFIGFVDLVLNRGLAKLLS